MTKYRKLQQPLFLHDGDTGETRVLSNVEWRDDVKPRQNMVVAELVDEKLEVSGDAEAYTMTGDLHEMIASCAANKTNYNMQVVKLETKRNIFDKMFSPLGPKLQKEDSSTKPPPKKKQKRDAIYCVSSNCYEFGDVQVKQSSFEQLRDGSLLCSDTVDLALGESFFCSLTHTPYRPWLTLSPLLGQLFDTPDLVPTLGGHPESFLLTSYLSQMDTPTRVAQHMPEYIDMCSVFVRGARMDTGRCMSLTATLDSFQ
jgi:hypothetical protein